MSIIDLGAHTNMTPTEALTVAQRRDWEEVIVIGFTTDSEGIVVISSSLPREKALWIIEHAKLHAMDRL
jgi:hypothetical protein